VRKKQIPVSRCDFSAELQMTHQNRWMAVESQVRRVFLYLCPRTVEATRSRIAMLPLFLARPVLQPGPHTSAEGGGISKSSQLSCSSRGNCPVQVLVLARSRGAAQKGLRTLAGDLTRGLRMREDSNKPGVRQLHLELFLRLGRRWGTNFVERNIRRYFGSCLLCVAR
jgi:hypothetical protein